MFLKTFEGMTGREEKEDGDKKKKMKTQKRRDTGGRVGWGV